MKSTDFNIGDILHLATYKGAFTITKITEDRVEGLGFSFEYTYLMIYLTAIKQIEQDYDIY